MSTPEEPAPSTSGTAPSVQTRKGKGKGPPGKRFAKFGKGSASSQSASSTEQAFAQLTTQERGNISWLTRFCPFTTRGLGFLVHQVCDTLNNSFRLLQGRTLDERMLYRVMLTLVERKLQLSAEHGTTFPKNLRGLKQRYTPVAPSWKDVYNLVNMLPTPLALYINTIGHYRSDDVEWLLVKPKSLETETPITRALNVFSNNIRELVGHYAAMTAEQRDVFRAWCSIPGLTYNPDNTAITNMDTIFPDGYNPREDWHTLSEMFEAFNQKAPKYFSEMKKGSGEGTITFTIGTQIYNIPSTNPPGEVKLYPVIKCNYLDIMSACLLLMGERDPEAGYTDTNINEWFSRLPGGALAFENLDWLNMYDTVMKRR